MDTAAKVSELKARLSAYLARVRRGETVLVLDRETPIARIVPWSDDEARIDEPVSGVEALRGLRPVRLRRPLDVVKLLREDRDAR